MSNGHRTEQSSSLLTYHIITKPQSYLSWFTYKFSETRTWRVRGDISISTFLNTKSCRINLEIFFWLLGPSTFINMILQNRVHISLSVPGIYKAFKHLLFAFNAVYYHKQHPWTCSKTSQWHTLDIPGWVNLKDEYIFSACSLAKYHATWYRQIWRIKVSQVKNLWTDLLEF